MPRVKLALYLSIALTLSLAALVIFYKQNQPASPVNELAVDRENKESSNFRDSLPDPEPNAMGTPYNPDPFAFPEDNQIYLHSFPHPDGIHWKQIGIIDPQDLGYPIRVERISEGNPDDDNAIVVSEEQMVANLFLVQLTSNASESELQDLVATTNGVLEPISFSNGLYSITIDDYSDPLELPSTISLFREFDQVVSYTEPDYLVSTSELEPNDPNFSNQWSMQFIDAPQAWSTATSAANQVIAIIDSGINLSHSDLSPNFWRNASDPINGIDDDGNGVIDDYFGYNAIDDSGDPSDEHGHGTAVAGIIGAVGDNGIGTAGITWDTQLMSLKFIGADGAQGRTSDAIKCIDYAIANNASVINASWGSENRSEALKQAIMRANEAGILFVAAAGNEGRNIDSNPTYPAAFELPNIIAVGATRNRAELASFTNYGRERVHIGAPGLGILAPNLTDAESYSRVSGTSFAAPFVSGAAALLLETYGKVAPQTTRDILMRSSLTLDSLSDTIASSGILNLDNALNDRVFAPANDSFESAASISLNSVYQYGNLEGSTIELNEPNPFASSLEGSAWYTFTAPYAAKLSVIASSGLFTPQIAIYAGSNIDGLSTIESGIGIGGTSVVEIDALESQTVYIQISGTGVLGPFSLQLELPPINDAFESSVFIDSDIFRIKGSNRFATIQDLEPQHGTRAYGLSTWWRFTAVKDGAYFVSTFGSDTDTIVAIYQGNSIDTLNYIGSNDNFSIGSIESGVEFTARQGETYNIAVDSATEDGGRFTIVGQYISQVRFQETPRSVSTFQGARVELSGRAIGPPPIEYQWLKNGGVIPGAVDNVLVLSPVTRSDFADFQLQATSPTGSIVSPAATISEGGSPPEIVFQPDNANILVGGSRVIRIIAKGSSPLDYQWYRDGISIPGATSDELSIENADQSDSGIYSISVSNNLGTVDSNPISVRVGDGTEIVYNWIFPRDRFGFVSAMANYDNRLYAGGSKGQILESQNGVSWTETANFGEDFSIRNLYSVGNKLFAADYGGDVRILDSPNSEWRSYDFPEYDDIFGIVYFNEKYFALVFNNIYASSDGVEWSLAHALPDRSGNIGLATANGTILAMKRGDSRVTFSRSSDGTNWESWDDTGFQRAESLHSLNGEYHLYADDTEWTSSNGSDWTNQGNAPAFNRIFEIQGEFFGQRDSFILRRLGHGNWEPFIESYDQLHMVQSEAGIIVGPHFGSLERFDDIESIYLEPARENEGWRYGDFKYIGNKLIGYGEGKVNISKGDLNGEVIDLNIRSIEYGQQNYVARLDNGISRGPSIGLLAEVPNSSNISDILAYGNGIFLAAGSEGLLTSSDGLQWTVRGSANPGFNMQIFALDRFIGLDPDGNSFESIDGQSWESTQFHTPFNGNYVIALSGGTEVAYALTAEGQLYSKTRERDWALESILPYTGDTFIDLAYGNGSLSAVNLYQVYYSQDANNWEEYNVNSFSIEGVAFGKDSFLVYGTNGDLIEIYRIDSDESSPPGIFPRDFSNNIYVQPHQQVDVTVDAFDLDGNIERIEFRIDGQLIETTSGPPHSTLWAPNSDGNYRLDIVAVDNDGLENSFTSIIRAQSAESIDLLERNMPSGVEDAIYHFGSLYVLSPTGSIFRTNDLENWSLVFTPPYSRPIALHTAGAAIIASSIGLSYRSENGYDWKVIDTGDDDTRFIRKSEDWLVAEDRNFDPLNLRSEDGLNWQSYDGSTLLASNSRWSISEDSPEGSILAIDPNGTQRAFSLPTSNGQVFRATSKNEKIYITVIPGGDPANAYIVSTTNFDSWETIDTPDSLVSISRFIVQNGLYYIASYHDAFVSTDLENWTPFPDDRVDSIEYVDGVYFAIGHGSLYRSTNGIDWQPIPFALGNRFLATELGLLSWDSDWSKSMWRSQSGYDWENEIQSDPEYRYKSIAYGNGIYLALGRDKLATSTDGIHFDVRDKPSELGESVAFGKGKFICLSPNQKLGISTNGFDWTYVDRVPGAINSERIFYVPTAEGFVIQTQFQNYQFSTDGENWEARSHAAGEGHEMFHLVKDLLFAEIGNRRIHVSSDANTWTHIEALQSSSEMAYWDGFYYGIGDKGVLMKSADGLSWEAAINPNLDWIEIVEPRDDGILVGTDIPNGYEYFHTSDGEHWTKKSFYDRWSEPSVSNEIVFFLSRSISRKVFNDLSLETITFGPGEYYVGAALEGAIELRNNSSQVLSFDSLRTDARLGADGLWLGNKGRTLESSTIGPATLGSGQSATFPFAFTVPNDVEPGTFTLNVAVNLDQQILETVVSNNYVWSAENSIVIPERKLNLQSNLGGEITVVSDQSVFAQGATINLIATPYSGFDFKSWDGTDSNALETASVILDTDKSVSAVFVQPFDSWISERFSLEKRSSPNTIEYDSDPDGDGFANALEYWFGTSPISSIDKPSVSIFQEEGLICVRITKSTAPKEYELELMSSTDARAWSPYNSTIESIKESESQEIWIYKMAIPSGSPLLFRFSIDLADIN